MTDLTEKELLGVWERVAYYFEVAHNLTEVEKQAYTQLVKIVKEHFSEPVQDVALGEWLFGEEEHEAQMARVANQERGVDEGVQQIVGDLRKTEEGQLAEPEMTGGTPEHLPSETARKEYYPFLEPVQVDEDTKNVIDNLVGLQECLEAGEDWCSVAIVAGAIELLTQKRTVTRNDVQNIAIDLKGEMIIDDIMEMVIAWLKKHDIEVVE